MAVTWLKYMRIEYMRGSSGTARKHLRRMCTNRVLLCFVAAGSSLLSCAIAMLFAHKLFVQPLFAQSPKNTTAPHTLHAIQTNILQDQHRHKDISFRRITSTNSGLSQNTPVCFLHDRTGFMWVGTQNGLNRFDGNTFKTFRKKMGDSTALLNDWILGLHEDGAGRMWVMTQQGVVLYDPRNHSFKNYVGRVFASQSVASARLHYTGGIVVDACNDKQGMPWFATENGVNIFNPADSTFTMIEDAEREQAKKNSVGSLAHKTTRALARDSAGTMWIGTVRGLHVYSPTEKVLRQFLLPNEQSPSIFDIHTASDGAVWIASDKGIYCVHNAGTAHAEARFVDVLAVLPQEFRTANTTRVIQSDASGYVWVLLQRGAVRIDARTYECFALIADPSNVRSDANNMSAMIADRNGDMWFGSYNGLLLWQGANEKVQRIVSDQTDVETLASNYIRSLYQDREGNIWVGSNTGGISMYAEKRNKFGVLRSRANNPQTLTNPSVRAFCENAMGMVWIGTDAGVNLFDPKSGRIVKRITGADLPMTNPGSFPVWAIAQTQDEHVWFGSLNFLVEADKTGKTIKIYTANPNDTTALTQGRVRSIISAPNGDVWVATGNFDARGSITAQFGGFNVLHRTTGNFTRRWTNVYGSILPTDYIVRVAMRDEGERNQGGFWVGAQNGVHRFHPDKGIVATYRHDPNNPRTLSSNSVNCILKTRAGTIWIGTSTGLNYFHENEEYFTHVGMEDGLPDDFVYGIQEDEQGQLWCSTNKGLVCYNPDTKQVRHYTPGDGVQEYEFNSGAFFKQSDGTMYFGGIAGMNYFKPTDILSYSETPHVILTGFHVATRPQFFENPLHQMQEITLTHRQNFIEIDFASLLFGASENIRYTYMLDGFDNEWQVVGAREPRVASYTGLPPGSYTFRVRATRSDGVWSNDYTTLRITILPPWWQTLWAQAIYTLIALGAFGGFIRYREARLRREKEVLTRAVQERTQELEKQKRLLEDQNEEVALTNAQLHEKNEQLEYLNREKNDMLAVVAHDLKNPLTGILLSAESIALRAEKSGDERNHKAAKRIEESAERTVGIITKILDVNALETGAITMKYESCALSEPLMVLVQDYTDRAKQKSITMLTNIPEEQMQFVCDKVGVIQIVDNLISNAIKYTHENHSVFVACSIVFRTGKNYLVVDVQDEGPGISTEDQAMMFQKFRRLSAKPTAGESTTGLGLSIVKNLLHAMQGTIQCRSEVGKGTRFTVEIPEHQAT